MQTIATAILAATVAGLLYFLNVLYDKRRELADLPCPPMLNWLVGHLHIAYECTKVFPSDVHAHNYLRYMQKKYNQGDFFYIDWWPLGPRWLFLADPELTSQYVTTGQSLPKSPLETEYMVNFLGDNNMVTVEGNRWKSLRAMFNPGFSGAHLMTLVSYIVDASLVFHDVLRNKAETGDLFQLEEAATRLTIDIIGKVVLDADLDSQKAMHPIVETFRERVRLMPIAAAVLDFSWLNVPRRVKLWRNGRKLDRLIGEELDRKYADGLTQKPSKNRKRSVIDLALEAYRKEQGNEQAKQSQSMDPIFRQNVIDSMKTFIFAGHDTTASTIAYVFYLLHFHPNVHKKMVAELDQLFGADADVLSIADAIKNDPHVINKFEYMTAVVKEGLRLFPPASTIRYLPEEKDPSKRSYMTDPRTGKKFPLNGYHIWPAFILIARNERFFPQPVDFVPERFLASQTPFPDSALFTPEGRDAWRPFEKGPRNCIGQELAMIEVKVILALVVREFDFVAEIDGVVCDTVTPVETVTEFADGRDGDERLTIEGHKIFQLLRGAAKPRDSMPGRLKIRL